jgi:hypothetical protein
MALMILLFTLAGNVILACSLVQKDHYVRYGWLTISTMFSIFADVMLQFCRVHIHHSYANLLDAVWTVCLLLNFMIVFEGWRWKNARVHVPVETQLGVELLAFLTQKAGLLWTFYYMQVGLRIYNILLIYWFIFLFRKEPNYGRDYAT